jgi:hypothetical protein
MRGKCSDSLYCEFRRGEKEIGGIRIEMKGIKLWFKLKGIQYLKERR